LKKKKIDNARLRGGEFVETGSKSRKSIWRKTRRSVGTYKGGSVIKEKKQDSKLKKNAGGRGLM